MIHSSRLHVKNILKVRVCFQLCKVMSSRRKERDKPGKAKYASAASLKPFSKVAGCTDIGARKHWVLELLQVAAS